MSDMKTEKVSSLFPAFQPLAIAFINKANSLGYNIGIFEAYRTWLKQEDDYQQGRSVPGEVITSSEPGFSWHQYSGAFDIAFIDENGNWNWPPDDDPRWLELSKIGVSMGLESGATFPIVDLDHYQKTYGLDINIEYNNFMQAGLKAVQADFVKAGGLNA